MALGWGKDVAGQLIYDFGEARVRQTQLEGRCRFNLVMSDALALEWRECLAWHEGRGTKLSL